VNILVFIKQVADAEARIMISGDGKTLEIDNKYVTNFFDEFAIEEAIRIRDTIKEGQVTVCTYGPARAIETLRTAIAMGADKAFLIDSTNYESEDPAITARILAAFAAQKGYDLILCGRRAIDDENAIIGPMMAEFLGIVHVSSVTGVDIVDGAGIRVVGEIEGGRKISDIVLPALLTTQKGLNEPRVPLITGVMKAMRTEIPTVDPLSLGIAKEQIDTDAAKVMVLSYEPPPQRPPVEIIEGASPEEKVKNLIQALREDAKVI